MPQLFPGYNALACLEGQGPRRTEKYSLPAVRVGEPKQSYYILHDQVGEPIEKCYLSCQVFWFPELAARIVNGSKSAEDPSREI